MAGYKDIKPRWKKGESGNPKGRPPMLPDLQLLLSDVLGKETNGKTAAQSILDALRTKAAKGDVRAAELLLDRGWGKVKQAMEVTGKDGESITQPMNDAQVDKIIASLREKK